MSSDAQMFEARQVLHRIFGHADFRGLQAGVVGEMLAGRNALAVLPTGGGKSVCFQVPGIIRPGVAIVISPLIALMADQVAGLRQLGVAAARLDSSLPPEERREIWSAVRGGALDLLYLSPEGLMANGMIDMLREMRIALIAIDEAHCVSQWGHDFRPEYRTLGRLADAFPGVPRIAVTATADARTREDIRKELRLEDAAEFVDSFDRPNLILSAERKNGNAQPRVIELVSERRGKAGVVYAGSRKGCEELAEALIQNGIPAMAYHAGLDPALRARRLESFLEGEEKVMVATIAFGMGVDKPDVRFVIHADPPASIEAYWQEVGRAGRDGEPAEGISLYGARDISWALRRIDEREIADDVKAVQTRKVRQLYAFLDGFSCRRAAVRRYFGESDPARCGQCDICIDPPRAEDATEPAQKLLAAVQRLGQRFGRNRVIDHLLGKDKAEDWERTLSTFGIGRDLSPLRWRELVDHLLFEGLLVENPNDGRPLLLLGETEAVRAVYRGQQTVETRAPAAEPRGSGRKTRASRTRRETGIILSDSEQALFDALKHWRRDEAAEQHVPPYVIFHDRTLFDIARYRPGTRSALGEIGGIGEAKLERYADAVLRVIAEFEAA